MNSLNLPSGAALPVLGLGTWRMGENAARRSAEVAAVRRAIELGYRLIDTAEMYGEGGAERIVGQAIEEAVRAGDVGRDQLFVVSKVYPHNASLAGTVAACDRSRSRLGLETIDLYLLHWRGAHPLRDTCTAMQSLVANGRIRDWGVSNFDLDDMHELQAVQDAAGAAGQPACAVNQVYYSLSARGIEFDLLPWQRARAMPMMAYSPIDQGALAANSFLQQVGGRNGVTAAQVALAWVLRQPGVVAIPKAVRETHLAENLAALDIALSADDVAEIERRFPPPRRKTPLAMI